MAVTTVAAPDAPRGDGTPAPPPQRGRRWPRRLLIGLNIFVATCLLSAGAVYGYVWWRFGQINRISIPGITSSSGGSDAPINILVVGSDSRAFVNDSQDKASFGSGGGVGGSRSDTTMVVHLEPKTGKASLLSIPRDLWVPIADKGYSQRINTAFDVGPDLLVRTIQDDLGIQINHYVDLDFKSFRQVVDALGGVKFWYPIPVHDTFSGLNITVPGCYTLTGETALALVRARHMTYVDNGRTKVEGESDLARIRRQQLFAKRVITKGESTGLSNITALNGVIGGIVNNITVDSGFSQKQMLHLARKYRSFNPDQLVTLTLPAAGAVVGGADVLLPIKDQDQAVIAQFLGQTSDQGGGSTTAAPATAVAPSTVDVRVLNGSGRTGEATNATRELRNAGFGASVGASGRADSFNYTTTVIKYGPSDLAKAQTLAAAIVGGAQVQPDSSLAGGPLILITGQSYGGVHAGAAPAAPPATTSGSTTTTLPANNSAKPAFPGVHGGDPPPPGSGC
ncbi:MAG: LCP family protein [Acidimicrobiales bacterium]